jgi:hypothetical protein
MVIPKYGIGNNLVGASVIRQPWALPVDAEEGRVVAAGSWRCFKRLLACLHLPFASRDIDANQTRLKPLKMIVRHKCHILV